MDNVVRFESKKDAWITTVLWFSNLICIATLIFIILEGSDTTIDIITSLILVLTVIVTHSILVNTYYLVSENELIIRMGFFTKCIPLSDITEMKLKVDILSSMALSIHRIHIRFKKSRVGVQISPVDRDGLITLVKERQEILSNKL